ncbi:hypothetical protein L7F22_025489 [Adiantum nelumboides]|nr:hypothetical protein [Adiantum nelumboides]
MERAAIKPWLKVELKRQVELAIPMIVINLLLFAVPTTSVMFVGHISELALSGASLAYSITNVTGLSLLMGLASALDILCGQAYGAQQYSLVGLYLQRALIVLYACSIPLAILWSNMQHILLALGQDAAISKQAGEFMLWLIPTLFTYSATLPLIRFMQAQSLVVPVVLCCACTICCHVPLCYALVFMTGLESQGAALATSISTFLNMLLLSLYVLLATSCEQTRTPFSSKAFCNLKDFLKLAVPSALMMWYGTVTEAFLELLTFNEVNIVLKKLIAVCNLFLLCISLEWWSYEALIIVSGWLPNPELETSVISVCYNCAAFAFMVPSGLGSMASTRIANELGAGRPDAARRAVYISAGLASCEAILVSVAFISLRNVLGKVYSKDEEAHIELLSYTSCFILFDFIEILGMKLFLLLHYYLLGIARGCGWQKAGAYINFASYYVVGLPVACILAFVFHIKAEGLWLGINSGAIVQLIALVAITWVSDWTKEVTKAVGRLPQDAAREPLLK